jgi:uncharacterized membrane protein
MSAAARVGRTAAVAVLAAGYAFLAHYTNTASHAATMGAVIALAPLLLGALSLAWHSTHRRLALSLCLLGCAALAASWPLLERHFSLLYWIEHAGTESLLCMAFARTLVHGREPMVTYFARIVHGSLTPALVEYTRRVTQAWTLLFGSIAVISTALFFGAPVTVWSAFANFVSGPLMILMFVVEYIVRRRLHPHMNHADILAGIQAFRKSPAPR